MARLTELPSQWLIDSWKGNVDFYLWKGIPVARKWPYHPPRSPTPAELAHQLAFKYILNLLPSINSSVINLYKLHAEGYYLTWRDYLTRAYLKGMLFEASGTPWASDPHPWSRVALLNCWHEAGIGEVKLHFVTDIPCLLYVIYTQLPPTTEDITKWRRGNLWYRDIITHLPNPIMKQALPDTPLQTYHWVAITQEPGTSEFTAFPIFSDLYTPPALIPFSPSTGPAQTLTF